MHTLHLPLKREYFEAISDGAKLEEYRLCTPHWRKRLEGQQFEQAVLTLGYPPRDGHSRRLALPWSGYTMKTITHTHFGPEPVEMFAIDVRGQL